MVNKDEEQTTPHHTVADRDTPHPAPQRTTPHHTTPHSEGIIGYNIVPCYISVDRCPKPKMRNTHYSDPKVGACDVEGWHRPVAVNLNRLRHRGGAFGGTVFRLGDLVEIRTKLNPLDGSQ